MFRCFSHSIRGYRHLLTNKPLQDSSGYKVTDKYAIVAVADGHGSEKYIRSDIGSTFAVESAVEKLSEFCENKKYCDTLLEAKDSKKSSIIVQIITSVIYRWRQKIIENYNKMRICRREAEIIIKSYEQGIKVFNPDFYGTTLLFACMSDQFNICAQIGDGKCSIIDYDGNVIFPLQDDDRLNFGVTTSLCDEEALNDFRYSIVNNSVRSIILASDGVVDSYSLCTYSDFVLSVFNEYKDDFDNADYELKKWLSILSEKGSQDDMSIGGVFRL